MAVFDPVGRDHVVVCGDPLVKDRVRVVKTAMVGDLEDLEVSASARGEDAEGPSSPVMTWSPRASAVKEGAPVRPAHDRADA